MSDKLTRWISDDNCIHLVLIKDHLAFIQMQIYLFNILSVRGLPHYNTNEQLLFISTAGILNVAKEQKKRAKYCIHITDDILSV